MRFRLGTSSILPPLVMSVLGLAPLACTASSSQYAEDLEEAEILFTLDDTPTELAVAGKDLYVATLSAGQVWMSREGGDPQPVWEDEDSARVSDLSADEEGAYWSVSGNVFGYAYAWNHSDEGVQMIGYGRMLNQMALAGEYIYTTSVMDEPGVVEFVRIPKRGGEALALGPASASVWDMAVDAESVYAVGTLSSALWSIPIGGGEARLRAEAQDGIFLAQSDTHLYWADRSGKEIRRIAKAGSKPELFRDGFANSLVADQTYLYFANADGLLRMPLEGGRAEIVYDSEGYIGDIAVNDSGVYWTEESNEGGRVMWRQK